MKRQAGKYVSFALASPYTAESSKSRYLREFYIGLYPGAPCLQIIPMLDPSVYKYYLHWVAWSLRVRDYRV